MTDTIELLANIRRREKILETNRRLARRKARYGYLLAGTLFILSAMCATILYIETHPQAPTYSREDRQALDQLIGSLR